MSWSKNDAGQRNRMTLSFSRLAKSRVAAMRVLTDAASDVAVVREALRLYDFMLQQRAEGWSVRLVKGDVAKKVILMTGAKL